MTAPVEISTSAPSDDSIEIGAVQVRKRGIKISKRHISGMEKVAPQRIRQTVTPGCCYASNASSLQVAAPGGVSRPTAP